VAHYKWLKTLRTSPVAAKPVANIFVVRPGPEAPPELAEAVDLALIHSFGSMSNGLMLAGYDVRTTFDHPLAGAALTVILAPGGWWDLTVDLPCEALQVLRGDSPVIVLTAAGLTVGDDWRQALPLLGISPGWEPAYLDEEDAMPETISLAGETVRWQGLSLWEYPAITSLVRPEDVTGELVLSASLDGQEVALITRNGKNVFVNGNLLNLDTSFIFNRLARLDEPTLVVPFYGYGVLGTRSAFMAMGDTQLRINLHTDRGLPVAEGTPLRVLLFDATGRLAANDQISYSPPFQADLSRHELIIVEVPPK